MEFIQGEHTTLMLPENPVGEGAGGEGGDVGPLVWGAWRVVTEEPGKRKDRQTVQRLKRVQEKRSHLP